MKKVGIITFHNSYNCGSMLESYAIQTVLFQLGYDNEIINFSNAGQKEIYNAWFTNNSLKNILKNIIIFPNIKKIKQNNQSYKLFQERYFKMSPSVTKSEALNDDRYWAVIAGSDQIWNITIKDFDDAYFLNWVKNAKKIAYAPSFGAKNILKYSSDPNKYANYLKEFNALSIREQNGKKWLQELIHQDVEVVLDPTLLLSKKDYDVLIDERFVPKDKFIFFYSPGFDTQICKYVKKIADKYKLKVITWSTKVYYVNFIQRFHFEIASFENPSIYLSLIKNAELVITTSFHGTIFSTIYHKKFITVKNGGMYGDDDRVITLLTQLELMDRLIPPTFDEHYNYLEEIDYSNYEKALKKLQKKSFDYLIESLRK